MNKKKIVFTATIQSPGNKTEEIVLENSLTVGTAPDCNITTSLFNFPGDKHSLVEKKASSYILRIPSGIDGSITIGKSTLTISGIIEFGFLPKDGQCHLFKLPAGQDCHLKIDGLTLSFARKEIIIPEKPKKKVIKLPREFKRHLISKEDYLFIGILIVSALIHFVTADYLGNIEVKKQPPHEAIKKIAPRFAKLILKPTKKKVVKKKVVVEKEAETEKPPEEKKEAKEKKKEEPVKKIKEKTPKKKLSPKKEAIAKRARKKKSVMSKGLLGVIRSKAMPDILAGNRLFSEVNNLPKSARRTSSRKNIDNLLSSFKGYDKTDKGVYDSDLSDLIDETPEHSGETRTVSDIISEKKKIVIEGVKRKKKKVDYGSVKPEREESEVYRTLRRYVGGLKYLYNNALKKDASLKGKIVVKFTIQADGRVKEAIMVSSTLDSKKLEKRIIKRIHKWRFVEIKGSDDYTINYTFDFAPVG